MNKPIERALLSVWNKDNLEGIVRKLHEAGVQLYSTGGTQTFIEQLGIPVVPVEELTGYPSILDGRVKTLHPKVFGGILARREAAHLQQLEEYDIPAFDLVITDLYPFEQTLAQTNDEATLIEKIDIGGVSLIRAAAKNFHEVAIVPSQQDYLPFYNSLVEHGVATTLEQRRALARRAFEVTAHYDSTILGFFSGAGAEASLNLRYDTVQPLRYGENPHQAGKFYGDMAEVFTHLHGKEISYNNLLDLDAALGLIHEFEGAAPTVAIFKHNNPCGVATRATLLEAWQAALACDPLSAFGGIIIANRPLDLVTAEAIHPLFCEAVLMPDYEEGTLSILQKSKNRILLHYNAAFRFPKLRYRSALNGLMEQELDTAIELPETWQKVTHRSASESQERDLLFALKCVKHLKSNAVALVKDEQLVGGGCGQTSRVDSLKHAIAKAITYGFDLAGAVMASEAFLPFADSVQTAHEAGISAVIQPGGSLKDKESIDYCNGNDMAMVLTGVRHFRH